MTDMPSDLVEKVAAKLFNDILGDMGSYAEWGYASYREAATRKIIAALTDHQSAPRRWNLGDKVRKKRGGQWRGTVCGFYSTPHTPEGYCVDSAYEAGSVQVWPAAALEDWNGND